MKGVSFSGLLFLVFLTLKLCHVIDWSWWIVFTPFWAPFLLTGILLGIVGAIKLKEARDEKKEQSKAREEWRKESGLKT